MRIEVQTVYNDMKLDMANEALEKSASIIQDLSFIEYHEFYLGHNDIDRTFLSKDGLHLSFNETTTCSLKSRGCHRGHQTEEMLIL